MTTSNQFSFSRTFFGAVLTSALCALPFYLGPVFALVCFGAAIGKALKFSTNKQKDIGFIACFFMSYLLILFLTTRTVGGQTDGSALFMDFQLSGLVVGLMGLIGWLFSPLWQEKHD